MYGIEQEYSICTSYVIIMLYYIVILSRLLYVLSVQSSAPPSCFYACLHIMNCSAMTVLPTLIGWDYSHFLLISIPHIYTTDKHFFVDFFIVHTDTYSKLNRINILQVYIIYK